MSHPSQMKKHRSALIPLAIRIAARDFRGGLSGFGVFLGCIALGVAAIIGVGSVSHGLSDGLAREGRRILGGDVSFVLIHRELSSDERNFLETKGSLSTIASMRAMARRSDGDAALVEIKAVPTDYPRLGEALIEPRQNLQDAIAQRNGAYGFIAEAALAARLELKIGERIFIGDAPLEFRGELLSEPDKLAGGIGFGPRVILSLEAFRTTGLNQPGSLVRWLNRLAISADSAANPASDETLSRVVADARKGFPDAGWEIRTRTNISPQFERNLDKFTQFLTLVGLTALIVGGVGVANAVHGYVDRKRPDIATLKSVGASGRYVFLVILIQVMAVAVMGICLGALIGIGIPYLIVGVFGAKIPFPLEPAIYPREIAAGALYGLLTSLTFSLGPLGRAHDIPVSALFRDLIDPETSWPRPRYLAMIAASALSLVGAIMWLATDRKLAVIYITATIGGFILLRLISRVIIFLARRAPRARSTELRLAIANIHRPGALTPSVVLSLGLGLALLVTLTMIDGNIRAQLNRATPGLTPSFFFLDVRSSEVAEFTAFLQQHAPTARIERVPMMRGRLVRLNNLRPEDVKPNEEAAWVLDGDRGITYSASVPDGSVLTKGDWWEADYSGPPLVSVEAAIADGLGLKIGDSITVNVLGRNISATIANLRKVNWRGLGINFVFVFSPNTFATAPHSHLATATFPKGADPRQELALLKDISRAYPSVTSIRVKDALDAIAVVMAQLANAVRGASAIALMSSVLVLAGALAAGRRTRIYDTVVLKTLGATRGRLLWSLILEYGILGLSTAAFGILAGSVSAWLITTRIMKLDEFAWLWSSAAAATAIAVLITVGIGLLGTWRALGQKPAPYLRNL